MFLSVLLHTWKQFTAPLSKTYRWGQSVATANDLFWLLLADSQGKWHISRQFLIKSSNLHSDTHKKFLLQLDMRHCYLYTLLQWTIVQKYGTVHVGLPVLSQNVLPVPVSYCSLQNKNLLLILMLVITQCTVTIYFKTPTSSLVNTVTTVWTGLSAVQFPADTTHLSSFQNLQSSSGAHQASWTSSWPLTDRRPLLMFEMSVLTCLLPLQHVDRDNLSHPCLDLFPKSVCEDQLQTICTHVPFILQYEESRGNTS